MRQFLLPVILMFICFQSGLGQAYPAYKITTYDTASKGYYFLCPINNGFSGKAVKPTHMILDDKGRVIYYKVFADGLITGDFKVWPDGLMSFYYMNKYYLIDSNFRLVDSVAIKNGYIHDLHDMQLLPNGHYLLMGIEIDTMDL